MRDLGRLALVLNGPEQAAPAKVPLHAPDQALQHLAHFAGPKVPEPLPGELAALPSERLAPGVRDASAHVIAIYYDARFGGRLPTDKDLMDLRAHASALFM